MSRPPPQCEIMIPLDAGGHSCRKPPRSLLQRLPCSARRQSGVGEAGAACRPHPSSPRRSAVQRPRHNTGADVRPAGHAAQAAQVHEALDKAVDKLYRPTPFPPDEARLGHLLAEYEKMAAPIVDAKHEAAQRTAEAKAERQAKRQAAGGASMRGAKPSAPPTPSPSASCRHTARATANAASAPATP